MPTNPEDSNQADKERFEDIAAKLKKDAFGPDLLLGKPELPSSGMLSRAEKIVDERMKKYGVPTESWTRIGRMWGAYLDIDDIPAEVCLQMMTMVKKIRERYEHHPDNWEDDAGYVDCAHRVMTDKLKKEGGGTPPEREPVLSTDLLTTEEVPESNKGFKFPEDL